MTLPVDVDSEVLHLGILEIGFVSTILNWIRYKRYEEDINGLLLSFFVESFLC